MRFVISIDSDKNSIEILYTTPETLIQNNSLTDILKELYKKNKLCLIGIDECHCISQWGYDFRPNYCKLKKLKNMFPKLPIIAVTATATKV